MKFGKKEISPGKIGDINSMKIFITGNLGYVGSELVKYLRQKHPDSYIAGFDTGFFKNLLTTPGPSPDRLLDIQYYGDVRKIDYDIINDFDCIIHLAAISNDPMGNEFKNVTRDINYLFSVELARQAVNRDIKNFVFASSCSVYGTADNNARSEASELNPLTEYAVSKVRTEDSINSMDLGNTIFTSLRFATACGISDRLRLDLVLNDFVASALINNKIEILSDGSPMRPLINVRDMCRAFDWGISRGKDVGGQTIICNAGSNSWNYSVKELALSVQEHFDHCNVNINKDAPPDKRSYKVDFSLFDKLAGSSYTPLMSLDETINDLIKGLKLIGFSDKNFRKSNLMRLNVLNSLRNSQFLNKSLYWRT